jgi:patatin-like phospholipase/acyl hydrolase
MFINATEKEITISIWSDVFKDVNGFRPRFDTSSWTIEDYNNAINHLSEEYERQQKFEQEQREAAVVIFEECIQKAINLGAADKSTACRWLMDSNDCGVDVDYFCYINNLPFDYVNNILLGETK